MILVLLYRLETVRVCSDNDINAVINEFVSYLLLPCRRLIDALCTEMAGCDDYYCALLPKIVDQSCYGRDIGVIAETDHSDLDALACGKDRSILIVAP